MQLDKLKEDLGQAQLRLGGGPSPPPPEGICLFRCTECHAGCSSDKCSGGCSSSSCQRCTACYSGSSR